MTAQQLTDYPVVNILLHIYTVHTFPLTPEPTSTTSSARQRQGHYATGSQESGVVDVEHELPHENGYAKTNGHAKPNGVMNGGMNGGLSDQERRQMRDAEEFELDALISDDEEGGNGGVRRSREGAVRM